jgi:hypothetical protein
MKGTFRSKNEMKVPFIALLFTASQQCEFPDDITQRPETSDLRPGDSLFQGSFAGTVKSFG